MSVWCMANECKVPLKASIKALLCSSPKKNSNQLKPGLFQIFHVRGL